MQPASVAADHEAVTRSHRRLYRSVASATLHPAALSRATLGCVPLSETAGQTWQRVAADPGGDLSLAGRIEFFDLRDADRAQQTLPRTLGAADEADAAGLGSVAHTACSPAWAGDRDAAVERMVAARTNVRRRTPPSAELLAWLDAVEAECETQCGHTRTALAQEHPRTVCGLHLHLLRGIIRGRRPRRARPLQIRRAAGPLSDRKPPMPERVRR
ncbi:hypothetical protein [Streptomyces sp. NPDC053367]|uniref:hypothetical protein n=1 Tax=Streptomyces sp. NPDC053367 TaxID=3365700 RepID=UPI0037CF5AEF